MPNIIKNISKAAKEGFKIVDDRGNPINIPPNEEKPSGIYRTYLNSNNATNVMVKIKSIRSIDETGNNTYPMGFTPEEAYYIRGTQSINDETGMNIEMGNVRTGVGLKNNTGVNKIARTDMSWSPSNASPLDGSIGKSQLFLTKQSLPGTQNLYGDNTSVPNNNISQGFTNPLLYITDTTPNDISGLTGVPKQFGNNPTNIKPNYNKRNPIFSDPNTVIKKEIEIAKDFTYRNIGTSEQQYTFVHNLDRAIPTLGSNNAYLASYIQTSEIEGKRIDNEDPTMFGYDIKIKFPSSPLFNGSIISFINQFNENSQEIESRRDIWITFCNQFFKFFKLDYKKELENYTLERYDKNFPDKIPDQSEDQKSTSLQTGDYSAPRAVSPETSNPTNPKTLSEVSVSGSYKNRDISGVKTYYLKKISGLENLVEKNISSNSESIKSMVDYGKDIIKLSLYEDVSINTGYLSMLYKTLTWSKLNGKQIIPENLLRFDVDITISEIRNYNRVFKAANSGTDLEVYADKLSKYTYTLYDCQFMFNEMSHENEIDMTEKKINDGFDISFNYKYSTLSFDKFVIPGNTQSMFKFSINNAKENVTGADGSVVIDNQIYATRTPENLKKYDQYPNHDISSDDSTDPISSMNDNHKKTLAESYKSKWDNFISSEEPDLEVAKRNDMTRKLLTTLGNKLQRAAIGELNRQISNQAKLLNKTLDNIRNSIGIGRMSPPTNVYDDPKYNQLINDTKNAFRDFVGQSVRGFFGP